MRSNSPSYLPTYSNHLVGQVRPVSQSYHLLPGTYVVNLVVPQPSTLTSGMAVGAAGLEGVRLIPVLISGNALPGLSIHPSTREEVGRDLPCYVSEIAGM